MDMIRDGNAKHHHHQTPVYRPVADKTPFRVSLAGVFPHQHMTVEHRLSSQQRQTPVLDVGFVFDGVTGEFNTRPLCRGLSIVGKSIKMHLFSIPVVGRQCRCSARSKALLGNAIWEVRLPPSWKRELPSQWVPKRSLGTSVGNIMLMLAEVV